mmetsp:Transcript_11358/g.52750  ORF Transcript_11358/g.52750 Transcript_11358/m.52750 type:complete len:264 (-) Transcript_11358:179-970(-)
MLTAPFAGLRSAPWAVTPSLNIFLSSAAYASPPRTSPPRTCVAPHSCESPLLARRSEASFASAATTGPPGPPLRRHRTPGSGINPGPASAGMHTGANVGSTSDGDGSASVLSGAGDGAAGASRLVSSGRTRLAPWGLSSDAGSCGGVASTNPAAPARALRRACACSECSSFLRYFLVLSFHNSSSARSGSCPACTESRRSSSSARAFLASATAMASFFSVFVSSARRVAMHSRMFFDSCSSSWIRAPWLFIILVTSASIFLRS